MQFRKIGLIQNAPLTADFSNNLRQIVQGYRGCLDHGAELVIAPAFALCGPALHDLINRASFLSQTQAALNALSQELGSAPLLLGACAPLIPADLQMSDEQLDDLVEEDEEDQTSGNTLSSIVPFLLEKDTVTELADAEVFQLGEKKIYVDVGDDIVLPDLAELDLIVHLGTTPWYASAAEADARQRQWEALNNEAPVVCVRSVGAAEGSLYGGGSCVCSTSGKTLQRLPFFETAHQVVNLRGASQVKALPKEVELLSMALCCGIRDTVRHNGYGGACLLLDHPNAPLLAALCVEALGRSNVLGITFDGDEKIAQILGISSRRLSLGGLLQEAGNVLGQDDNPALKSRLASALLASVAEERGLMLLSPLDRHDAMVGNFTLYGESCGYLAPLGNLYTMDIHLLCKCFSEKHPDLFGVLEEPVAPEQDRIIHELADCNASPSSLLKAPGSPFQENDVRFIQRRLIASALKRSQFPLVLHVDSPAEQLSFPISHRLND